MCVILTHLQKKKTHLHPDDTDTSTWTDSFVMFKIFGHTSNKNKRVFLLYVIPHSMTDGHLRGRFVVSSQTHTHT